MTASPAARPEETGRPLLLLFVLIDLLCVPRLTPVASIPVSLAPVLFFALKEGLRSRSRPILPLLFAGLVAVSAAGWATLTGSEYWADNIKRGIQLVSIFAYSAAFVRPRFERRWVLIALRAFLVVQVALVVLFWSAPEQTTNAIAAVFPESRLDDDWNPNVGYFRYPYVFSDPNSAAYLVVIVFALYLVLERAAAMRVMAAISSLLVVAATQSRGGAAAYALTLCSFAAIEAVTARRQRVILGVIVGGLALAIAAKWLMNLDAIEKVLTFTQERADLEDSLGGGRGQKYLYFWNHFNPFPLGVGYTLEVDGQLFRTHSDLIRLNLSYGLVVLGIVLWYCAPRRLHQIPLFAPFIVGFLINTIVDDYRLLGPYLLAMRIAGALPTAHSRRLDAPAARAPEPLRAKAARGEPSDTPTT